MCSLFHGLRALVEFSLSLIVGTMFWGAAQQIEPAFWSHGQDNEGYTDLERDHSWGKGVEKESGFKATERWSLGKEDVRELAALVCTHRRCLEGHPAEGYFSLAKVFHVSDRAPQYIVHPGIEWTYRRSRRGEIKLGICPLSPLHSHGRQLQGPYLWPFLQVGAITTSLSTSTGQSMQGHFLKFHSS